tara:strand:- start:3 stop:128 length:126 start_codon:yes stop_codon:yes gene_type:complete
LELESKEEEEFFLFEKNIDTKNDLRRPKKVNNVAAKLSLLL